MTSRLPDRDRPLVLHELLDRIARLRDEQADPDAIEQLAQEYRQLRAEL